MMVLLGMFSSCDRKGEFAPPSPEKIVELLEFKGPVSLHVRSANEDELKAEAWGNAQAKVAWAYSDPAHTSDTISVIVFNAGTCFGDKRAEFIAAITKEGKSPGAEKYGFGVFKTSDGRELYSFPMGFGPGGSADGVLIQSRDKRFELMLTQSTSFHDGEDPKSNAGHVSPTKNVKSIVEAVEKLVFR